MIKLKSILPYYFVPEYHFWKVFAMISLLYLIYKKIKYSNYGYWIQKQCKKFCHLHQNNIHSYGIEIQVVNSFRNAPQKMIKCFSFTINIPLQNATRDYLNSREGYSLNVCSEKMDLSLWILRKYKRWDSSQTI